jgi:hypothetical protein
VGSWDPELYRVGRKTGDPLDPTDIEIASQVGRHCIDPPPFSLSEIQYHFGRKVHLPFIMEGQNFFNRMDYVHHADPGGPYIFLTEVNEFNF